MTQSPSALQLGLQTVPDEAQVSALGQALVVGVQACELSQALVVRVDVETGQESAAHEVPVAV